MAPRRLTALSAPALQPARFRIDHRYDDPNMGVRGDDHVVGQNDATRVQDDVAGLLERLSALDNNIELLVLFGSIARGDASPESDVDLLVGGPVTRDLNAWSRLRGHLIETLGRPVGLLSIDEAKH